MGKWFTETVTRLLQWLGAPLDQLAEGWTRWRTPILLGAGTLIGLGTSRLLGATSTGSVQLQIFLGLFVALPALTLLSSLISIWRYPTRHTLVQSLTALGLGYGGGGILSMLLLYFSNYVGVHMFTTFPEVINQHTVPQVIGFLAAPWRLLGISFPVSEMTAGLVNSNLGPKIDPQLAIAWRNFILLTVLLYTVLPRLGLWLVLRFKLLERIGTARKSAAPSSPTATKPDELFAISWQTDDLRDYLELSPEEHRLLSALQALVVQQDVANESDVEAKKRKVKWQQDWLASITALHQGEVVYKESELLDFVRTLHKRDYPKLRILLFELLVFRPYFPLADAKDVKKIKFDESRQRKLLRQLARKSGESLDDITQAVEAYRKQLQRYTARPKWAWVAMAVGGAALFGALGFAAIPAIGHWIGVSHGLAGIAAKLGGLAMLGGGAVSIGGLGVAGSTAVIVGGGAVLGAGGGLATVYLLPEGSRLVANDVAKFETVVLFLLQDKVQDPLDLIRQKLSQLSANLNSAVLRLEQQATVEKLNQADKAALKEAKRGFQLVQRYLEGLDQDFKSSLQPMPHS